MLKAKEVLTTLISTPSTFYVYAMQLLFSEIIIYDIYNLCSSRFTFSFRFIKFVDLNGNKWLRPIHNKNQNIKLFDMMCIA